MEPLEDVDGVSESIVAQGQIIPAGVIAAGAPTCHPNIVYISEVPSAGDERHERDTQPIQAMHASDRHCNDRNALGIADGASESIHIRTGPLLSWALDYAGTLSVLVQTETAWCGLSLPSSPGMPCHTAHASPPASVPDKCTALCRMRSGTGLVWSAR